MQLDTETLKEAAQRLWLNMCAPTRDGSLIPAEVYRAYQEGAAFGIEFIFGIPNSERLVFRSFIGESNYRDLVSAEIADLKGPSDSSGTPDTNAELVEHRTASGMLQSAAALKEGGNKVHLLYWDEDPLIESLGSGTVDAAATLLGNRDALELYGSVMNEDLSEVLQCLLVKFMSGNDLELYQNEIRGVDALDWNAFPGVLIASKGKLICDTIDDRITGGLS